MTLSSYSKKFVRRNTRLFFTRIIYSYYRCKKEFIFDWFSLPCLYPLEKAGDNTIITYMYEYVSTRNTGSSVKESFVRWKGDIFRRRYEYINIRTRSIHVLYSYTRKNIVRTYSEAIGTKYVLYRVIVAVGIGARYFFNTTRYAHCAAHRLTKLPSRCLFVVRYSC